MPTRRSCTSALLNLCRNSADAVPDGGVITVAARNVEPSPGAAQGIVEIVVADDGEGMPEAVLSQAFTPYFTTKPVGSGTGLGLLQVQRFAEGRSGAVSIESERGVGTLALLWQILEVDWRNRIPESRFQ